MRCAQGTVFIAAILVLLLVACANGSGTDRPHRDALAAEANRLERALAAAGDSASAGSLRVRLAFGGAADLDLYVTDPNHETAYFANTPTQLGAQLAQDVLCGTPAPRVETVTLEEPVAGRYRVGVDYPRACGDDLGRVSFVVFFERDERRDSRRGSIKPGEFLAIVLEAELE